MFRRILCFLGFHEYIGRAYKRGRTVFLWRDCIHCPYTIQDGKVDEVEWERYGLS
jgi:hypothetical protein